MYDRLAVVSHRPGLAQYELYAFCNALEKQLRKDFLPVWGRYVTPFVARDGAASPDAWQLHLWDGPQALADLAFRGRHAFSRVPTGHVFETSSRWAEIASHEVLEMLVNPYVNQYAVRRFGDQYELWPQEICDPVQGQTYAVDKVLLANFVYPAYFVETDVTTGVFDHLRKLQGPFTIANGGYSAKYTVSASGQRQLCGLPLATHARLEQVLRNLAQ